MLVQLNDEGCAHYDIVYPCAWDKIQANEAAKCLGEKVLRTVADGNIGSIFGLGFAPYTGGMLQFINAVGVAKFVARCDELAAKYGERFQPAPILRELAAQGKKLEDVSA